MLYGNKLVILFVIAKFLIVLLPANSFAQEFDWDEDLIQARNPSKPISSSSSGLPGVSNDPYAAREARKFCNQTSLAEAFNEDFPSGKCPRKSLTIFEIQTDNFVDSPK